MIICDGARFTCPAFLLFQNQSGTKNRSIWFTCNYIPIMSACSEGGIRVKYVGMGKNVAGHS